MKFSYSAAIFIILLCGPLIAVIASMDPVWMYKDLPVTQLSYCDPLAKDTRCSFEFNTKYPVKPASFTLFTSDGCRLGLAYSTTFQQGTNLINRNSIINTSDIKMAIVRIDADGCRATQQIKLAR